MKLLKMLLVTLLSSQLAFAAGTPPGSPPPERPTDNSGDKNDRVAEEPQHKKARPEPPPAILMPDPAELLGLTVPTNTQKVAMTGELATSYVEQIRRDASIFLDTNVDVLVSLVDARLQGVVGDETVTFKELAGYLRSSKHAEAILRLAELRHMELVGDDVIARYDAHNALSELLRSRSLPADQSIRLAFLYRRLMKQGYLKVCDGVENIIDPVLKSPNEKPEFMKALLFQTSPGIDLTRREIESHSTAYEFTLAVKNLLRDGDIPVDDSRWRDLIGPLRAIANRHDKVQSIADTATELANSIESLLRLKKQFETAGRNQLSAAHELALLFIDGQIDKRYASEGLKDALEHTSNEDLKTELGAKAIVAGLRIYGAPEHKKNREKMMTIMNRIINHHGIKSEVGVLACRGMGILFYAQLRNEIKSYSQRSHSEFVTLLRDASEYLGAHTPDGAWARLELFRVHFNAFWDEPYELPQEARLSDIQVDTYLNQVIESSPIQQDKTDALKYQQLLRKPIRERLEFVFRADDLVGGGPYRAFRLAHLYDLGIGRDDLPAGYIDWMMKFIGGNSFTGKKTYLGLLAFIRAQIRNGIDEAQKNRLKHFLKGDFWGDYNDRKMFAERDRLIALLKQTGVHAEPAKPDEARASSDSSSSGSSDVASAAEPEQKKTQRQEELIRKPYKWGQKYLPGEKPLSKPFVKGAAEKADWLKTPDVTFVRLKNIEPAPLILEERVNAIGMSAMYLSELGLNMSVSRTTFVFPGRMENGLIPVEQDGGRIVLVIPAEHEAEAQNWVSPRVDVLVVHSIDGIHEQELKLLTPRRLAAFIFAKSQRLEHFFTLDDNVQNLYGNFKTWPEVYAHFLKTAENKDATCLSGRTFRPEEDTDGKPSGAWNASMDDIGSKFFFFRGAGIYKLMNLHKLLPHRMKLCAEDLWMQTMLRAHRLGVGVVDRKAFVFTRSKKYVSVCKKTVGLADEWLRAGLEQEIAAFNDPLMTQTLKAVAEQARLNIEANNRRNAGRADADLGQEAFDVEEKRKGKLAQRDQISDSFIDLTKGHERAEPDDQKKQKKKSKTNNLDAKTFEAVAKDANTGLARRKELVRLVNEFVTKHAGKSAAFDHQLEALQSLTEEALGEDNAAFGISATGTGKTTEFLMLIALAMQSDLFNGENIALVAPRLNLVGQHYEEIEEFNKRFAGLLHIDPKKVVKIGSGNHNQEEIENNKFMSGGGHLAIFVDRSLKNFFLNKKGKDEAGKRADLFSFFLIDELHTMSDDTLGYLLTYCKTKGALTVGFTATPKGKGELFKKAPAFVFTSNQGVEGGFLCPWINDAIDMEYSRENFEAIVPHAADILNRFPHPGGGMLSERNTFIFVPNIEDAQKVALALQKAGIKAEPVHSPKKLADGTILKSDPEGAIRRFDAGQTKVLVAVDMLSLGTDLKVDFVWFMTGELSEAEYIQRRGRALRGGRRNDKDPALPEGIVRARDSKIAYILSWKNTLPQSKEHACPLLNDYALSPDYMGLFEDERHFGHFKIKPYFSDAQPDPMDVSEDEGDVTIYGENAGAFQEDIDTQRANLESIRAMTQAEAHGHTGDFQVRVRATPADGDCGFHATDITRAEYVAKVLEYYRGAGRANNGFMTLVDEAMALLGVNNIEQWAREYARSVDGHFVHYLDATNMRIMSLLFNLRIFLYTVNGERGAKFVPLQGEDGFIYAGNDYRNARSVHLAWINLEPVHPNGPLALNHFERLLTIYDREFYPQNTFIGLDDALEEVGRGTTRQLRNLVANFAAAAILGLTLQKNMK